MKSHFRSFFLLFKLPVRSLLGLILLSISASAAPTVFLRIEGIPGESVVENHAGDIELSRFSVGFSNVVVTAGGAAVGKPVLGELVVTKPIDKGSSSIAIACAGAQSIKTVTLFVSTIGEKPVDIHSIVIENVNVTSITTRTDASGAVVEDVTFTYTRITWAHRTISPTGAVGEWVRQGYDARAGKTF